MRQAAAFVAAVVLVVACSAVPSVPGMGGPPHPACLTHETPTDCQAAVTAALPDLPALTDPNYVFTVQPILCGRGECSTWIEGTPKEGCLPSWSVQMSRPIDGTWKVALLSHGDPPCAFESPPS